MVLLCRRSSLYNIIVGSVGSMLLIIQYYCGLCYFKEIDHTILFGTLLCQRTSPYNIIVGSVMLKKTINIRCPVYSMVIYSFLCLFSEGSRLIRQTRVSVCLFKCDCFDTPGVLFLIYDSFFI